MGTEILKIGRKQNWLEEIAHDNDWWGIKVNRD